MATEIEVDAMVQGIGEHFGSMDEQNFEAVGGHIEEGFRQIIAAVIVRVINPDKPETVGIVADF
jgi:hypothetical protein